MDGPDAPGRGDGLPASGRDQQEAVLAAGPLQGRPPPGPRMGTKGSVVFWLRHVWALVGMLHTPSSRASGRLRVTAAARATRCSRTTWQGRGARRLAFLPPRPGPRGGRSLLILWGASRTAGGFPPSRVLRRPSGAPPLHVREAPAGPPSSCLCGKHLSGPAEDQAWGLSRPRLPQQGQMPVFPAEQTGPLARPALPWSQGVHRPPPLPCTRQGLPAHSAPAGGTEE